LFKLQEELADFDTVGVIFDFTDRKKKCPCRCPGPVSWAS